MAKKKPVECPICDCRRICDSGSQASYHAERADKKPCDYDIYVKCWKCKQEIGLKKKEAELAVV